MAEHIDNAKPHFDISAYVVRQLGEQLVSDEVTALMELVKNSYDADADYVNIVINTSGKLLEYDLTYQNYNGYILIEDNGHGMTESEINKGWLTISVSKKRQMKIDGGMTEKGRTPLGEKGLGRLSTQRLAGKLELFTHNPLEASAYHVNFDWDDFTEDALLTKVDVAVAPVPKKSLRKGTTLALLDIRDPKVWLGDNLERIKGKLSQLIFPKKRKRPFSVYFTVNGTSIDLDFVTDTLKELAISRYSFSFYDNTITILGNIKLPKLKGNDPSNYTHLIEADNGKNFFDFISSTNAKKKKPFVHPGLKYCGRKGIFATFRIKLSIHDVPGKQLIMDDEQNEMFLSPGNFKGKLEEYNFTKDGTDMQLAEEIFKDFTKYTTYVKSQTGIRVFRDGFGIRPFGLDGEDWLGLSKEQTSGSSFYGLRPGNVIGYIEITAKGNPYLLEKTDREGIIDNFFYKNFHAVNKKVIKEINNLLESIKRGYGEYRKQYGVTKTGLNNQKEVFDLMKKTGNIANNLISVTKDIEEEVRVVNKQVKGEIRAINNSPLFSKADEVRLEPLLKSVEQQLNNVEVVLAKVNSLLQEASNLTQAVHIVEPQITTLQDQLQEFSNLAGLGVVAEALAHEIDNTLDSLSEQRKSISDHLKAKKITDSSLLVFLQYVNSSVQSLRKQVSYLSPSLKYLREDKEVVSLKDAVINVGEIFKRRLHDNDISLSLNVVEDFSITANKGKLNQIFSNLLLNSIFWLSEFAPGKNFKPAISVEINKPLLRFSDNGQGIDPNVADRLFQPFVTSKPKGVGRGLGLFIVLQLLEYYNADIILLPDLNEYGRRYIFQINLVNLLK